MSVKIKLVYCEKSGVMFPVCDPAVCVFGTHCSFFMSDNLPPVIGPPLTPGPESSTGSAHHSDGHAAAASTSAAGSAHATEDVNPTAGVLLRFDSLDDMRGVVNSSTQQRKIGVLLCHPNPPDRLRRADTPKKSLSPCC